MRYCDSLLILVTCHLNNANSFLSSSARTWRQLANLMDWSSRGWQERGKKLVSAALTLYDTLSNLNEDECALIEGILGSKAGFIFDRISSKGMTGLNETAYQLALLFSLMTGKSPPRYQAPQKRSQKDARGVPTDEALLSLEAHKRGKRPGDVKNWIFQNFVFDLLTSTAVAGGKLPHDKNRPGRPLVKAIRMLEPHLPDGFMPNRLPRSTLQRIRTRYNKIKAYLDDLEND